MIESKDTASVNFRWSRMVWMFATMPGMRATFRRNMVDAAPEPYE